MQAVVRAACGVTFLGKPPGRGHAQPPRAFGLALSGAVCAQREEEQPHGPRMSDRKDSGTLTALRTHPTSSGLPASVFPLLRGRRWNSNLFKLLFVGISHSIIPNWFSIQSFLSHWVQCRVTGWSCWEAHTYTVRVTPTPPPPPSLGMVFSISCKEQEPLDTEYSSRRKGGSHSSFSGAPARMGLGGKGHLLSIH